MVVSCVDLASSDKCRPESADLGAGFLGAPRIFLIGKQAGEPDSVELGPLIPQATSMYPIRVYLDYRCKHIRFLDILFTSITSDVIKSYTHARFRSTQVRANDDRALC